MSAKAGRQVVITAADQNDLTTLCNNPAHLKRLGEKIQMASRKDFDPQQQVRLVQTNLPSLAQEGMFPHPGRSLDRTTNSEAVRRLYAGSFGAALRTLSILSLHVPLSKQWFRDRLFDLRGTRRILDAGCGSGQLTRHLAQYADPDASINACDFSVEMLRRARRRLENFAIQFVLGDLTQLPFADASFDCVTCGYAIEHLSNARSGLSELARVLCVGGRMLLLTTENKWSGQLTASMWNCRAYNRQELQYLCHEQGLIWKQELWHSSAHQLFGMGGICVEIERQGRLQLNAGENDKRTRDDAERSESTVKPRALGSSVAAQISRTDG